LAIEQYQNSRGHLPPMGAVAQQRDIVRLTCYVLEHYPAEGWSVGGQRLRWQAVNRLRVPLSYLWHLQAAWDATAQRFGHRSLTAAAARSGESEVRRLLETTVAESRGAGQLDDRTAGQAPRGRRRFQGFSQLSMAR
jgi:hypothetical protein